MTNKTATQLSYELERIRPLLQEAEEKDALLVYYGAQVAFSPRALVNQLTNEGGWCAVDWQVVSRAEYIAHETELRDKAIRRFDTMIAALGT